MGHTSVRFAETLREIGAGRLIVAEWDPEAPERADATQSRLEAFPDVSWKVVRSDALTVIRSLPEESVDFAFVDDDHRKAHVSEELQALLPKMAPKGLICCHDVFGVCDLQEVVRTFGGFSLDLPMLGPAGGLGIIQVL